MTDVTKPQEQEISEDKPRIYEPWQVILFNDDVHSFDEVIMQMQKATSCSLEEAKRVTFEAHMRGKAVAFRGTFSRCHIVAEILRQIELIVEIRG